MTHKPVYSWNIEKFDFYGTKVGEFNIGDEVDLEDYPPDDPDNPIWRAVIVHTYDYDGDVDDDTGRSITIPAKALVAIIPRNVVWEHESKARNHGYSEPWFEYVDIDYIYAKGELYEDS